MRVVIIAPLVAVIDHRLPQLGGAQALVADLAAGLAEAGHEVTLVAPQGSRVKGAHVLDLGLDASRFVPASLYTAAARRDDAAQRDAFARIRSWIGANAESIDVVHAHAYDAPAFDALEGAPRPVVHTLHLPPTDPSVVVAARRATAALVTVSAANAAAWAAAGARVAAVIHNGVDLRRIPVGSGEGGYLLAAGRIAPEKGSAGAARVAREAGLPLLLAGPPYDEAARDALGDAVRERPDWRPGDRVDGALWIGPRPRDELFRIMGSALALLMPVQWDEPFGLVAAEAMAAGTPVIGYRRGGLAEVVADGGTGILVAPGDEAALARAVRRVGTIDRGACRAHVAARFSLERMVAAHDELYRRL